jgi:hypothetical protein
MKEARSICEKSRGNKLRGDGRRVDQRGNVWRLAVVAAVVLAFSPAEAATFTCGGFAPLTTACSTGTRTRNSGLSHDVVADFNYIGTIESLIVWSGDDRAFRCTYTQIGPRTCLSTGDFPPVGASFTHRCRSLVPGTVIEDTVTGVEGGVGTWQCKLTI